MQQAVTEQSYEQNQESAGFEPNIITADLSLLWKMVC